jgi:Outer membrane protein beta-barrel domain
MKFAQLFILILAFLIINPARAGLLVEPVLGYSFATMEGNENLDLNGTSYGGRLGYQNLGFQLGLDYLSSGLSVDDNDYKSDFNTTEFAGFVGFEFPILLRVYAGYIFQATGETDLTIASIKNTLEYDQGSGTKLGVGFTGLPFVDINFEYRKGKLSNGKWGALEVDDLDYSTYMVGISLPFVL